MTPQVPPRRVFSAVLAVVVLLGSLLVAVLLTDSGASAAPRSTSSRPATHGDPLLARLLQRLANAQGIHRRGTPISLPTGAPTSAPATGAPTSTDPSPSAPVSASPTGDAPTSTSTPTSAAPTTAAPTSDDPSDPTVAGAKLVYADNFDGPAGSAPDPQSWQARYGGKWGDELECYTTSRKNSSLDGNGDLVLTARYDPNHQCSDNVNNYTSARLDSQGLEAAKYGQIRVRAKVPSAQGVWPAIWLLGANMDQVGWPACGEIDMMEAIGQNKRTIYGTVHGAASTGGQWAVGSGNGYQLDSDMDTHFHIYGLDWSPTKLVISVDGHVVMSLTKAQVLAAGNKWVFDQPFFILLNVAVGGSWAGTPQNNGVFPQSMTVDYVRVYE